MKKLETNSFTFFFCCCFPLFNKVLKATREEKGREKAEETNDTKKQKNICYNPKGRNYAHCRRNVNSLFSSA